MSERLTAPAESGPSGRPTRATTALGGFPALVDDGVERLRNIRYAHAGRFAPPQPLPPDPDESAELQHVVVACPQPPSAADEIYGPQLRDVRFTEDCLRLTVTRPAGTGSGDALPVMVWVHGGAYVSGAGDLPGYDPAALVREQQVVVVAVTYRLGALGFLGDDAVDDGGATSVPDRIPLPLNLGLLDVLAALGWVRDHVAAFGGDPDRVTVFGQSAGADLLAHVLGADGADGLFRRAILQSAPLGLRGGRDEVRALLSRTAGDLTRTGPVAEVLDAQVRAAEAVKGMNDRAGMPFAPACGHAPLPPEAGFLGAWRRRAPDVDLLVTWTSQDGSAFVHLDPKGRALLDRPLVGKALFGLATRKVTDVLFRTAARRFARDLVAAGGTVVAAEVTARVVGNPLGATHAVELGLLFPRAERWAAAPVIGPDGAADLVAAGRDLRAAWAEFARGGRSPGDVRVADGTGWTGGLRVVRP
jgi:para-nitrobenzyl esterase